MDRSELATVFLLGLLCRDTPGDETEPLEAAGYRVLGLTARQAQVLALVVEGKPNKAICRELGLAVATVKIHVTAILRALGVANRTQAAFAVSRLGLRLPAPVRV
jgi:DNA-binding NarL/FixJ family response regulator